MATTASDWGQPEISDSIQVVHQPRSKAVVPDDWEDEEDEDFPNDEANKILWEKANSKAPTPMPVVNTTSRSITSPPPPAAFQPALKILKRPTNSTTTVHPRTPSPASSESLKDREARYQEARDRIFGDSSSPSATITRNPYGPSPSQSTPTDGFKRRPLARPSGSSK